jgi:hypothetical protein
MENLKALLSLSCLGTFDVSLLFLLVALLPYYSEEMKLVLPEQYLRTLKKDILS